MEESEFDTQYLQNMFKVLKRQLFVLFLNLGSLEKKCVIVSVYFRFLRKRSLKVIFKCG